MKAYILFRLCILLLLNVILGSRVWAQAPEWQTLLTAAVPQSGSWYPTATATDAAGNIYITGSFYGTVVLGNTTLTSAGSNDIFVAKWSPTAAAFVWVQRVGGDGDDVANAIAVTGTGIYLAGYFYSTNLGFGGTTLVSAGAYDVFVAKLTDTGSAAGFAWAQQVSTAGFEVANAIAVQGTNVYIGGYYGYNSTVTTFGSIPLSSGGNDRDLFLAKLTDTGSAAQFVWAQKAGSGPGYDGISKLVVNGPDVYAVGYCNGFGTNNTPRSTVSFLAKTTDVGSSGQQAWFQTMPANVNVSALAANGTALYVGGNFTGAATLGSISLTSNTGADAFVARLADMGSSATYRWVQQTSGSSPSEAVMALATKGSQVFAAGYFSGSTSGFGPASLTSAGQNDLFLTKLTDLGTAGRFDWAQRAGGGNDDVPNAVMINNTSAYVAGYAGTGAEFGSLTLSASNTTQIGFLAALTDNTITASAAASPLPLLPLYPNPASSRLTVPTATSATVLTLLDATSRVVRTATGSTLSVQGLAPGLYLLRAATPGQPPRTARLLVE